MESAPSQQLELYTIVANHLAEHPLFESEAEFIEHILNAYLTQHPFSPPTNSAEIDSDQLRVRIRNMLKKKIYGYYSLNHYRATHKAA